MPLNNNAGSKRIDEMAKDVETQRFEKMRLRKSSMQMDESSVRGSREVLIGLCKRS